MSYYDPGLSDEDLGEWLNVEDIALTPEFMKDLVVPCKWLVMVMPLKPQEVSKGGIVIPQSNQAAQSILNTVGRVIALGPTAGLSPRLGGDETKPHPEFPKVGDFVLYGRYAGQKVVFKGVKMLVLNDDELLGKVPNPSALAVTV